MYGNWSGEVATSTATATGIRGHAHGSGRRGVLMSTRPRSSPPDSTAIREVVRVSSKRRTVSKVWHGASFAVQIIPSVEKSLAKYAHSSFIFPAGIFLSGGSL